MVILFLKELHKQYSLAIDCTYMHVYCSEFLKVLPVVWGFCVVHMLWLEYTLLHMYICICFCRLVVSSYVCTELVQFVSTRMKFLLLAVVIGHLHSKLVQGKYVCVCVCVRACVRACVCVCVLYKVFAVHKNFQSSIICWQQST